MRKEGKTQEEIAEALKRNKSSISRELKRNKLPNGTYQHLAATIKYLHRRKKSKRTPRLADETARKFVEDGLDRYWSPEIISNRWSMEHPGTPLCHSTIYRALKRKELPGYSRKTHLRRRGKRKNVHQTKVIHPAHTIHDRPEVAEQRSRLGDMEGDTVYGGIGKGVAVTAVDRMSRMLYATLCRSRDSGLIEKAFGTAFSGTAVKSLTLDNGSEFAKFPEIENTLSTTVYFADPHSPWQRGSVENANGLLRFFYPKGTDFNAVDDVEFQNVIRLINDRPRKCLGWLSPLEFFSSFCCTSLDNLPCFPLP
jgi:IS30 family transposase